MDKNNLNWVRAETVYESGDIISTKVPKVSPEQQTEFERQPIEVDNPEFQQGSVASIE